jgi:exodeoxyribonuclease V alpha subunit
LWTDVDGRRPPVFVLLRALRMGCRLVLVGDPDQLPPWRGQRVHDLIASERIDCIHLEEIFDRRPKA